MGEIPLKSISFTFYLQSFMKINTYPRGKKSSTSLTSEIYSLNMQKSNTSHAFAGDGEIYLHDGEVFALEINLLQFLSSVVGQTDDRMTYFPRFH